MLSSNKNTRSLISFLVIAAIVFWIIWFGASSFFGKKVVESGLQQMSAQLAEYGKKYGKNVNLKYGEISIEGWGSRKKAVIDNVSVNIGSSFDPFSILISTKNVVVTQDPIDFNKIIMNFSNPIDVSQGDKILNSVVSSEPIIYGYKELNASTNIPNDKKFMHDIILPKMITVLKPAIGNQDTKATETTFVINSESNPIIQLSYQNINNETDLKYAFSGITFSDRDNVIVKVSSLIGQATKKDGDKEGYVSTKNLIHADNVVFYRNQEPIQPYNVKVDLDSSDESKNWEENISSIPAAQKEDEPIKENKQNSDMLVNDFIISNPDFTLKVSGKLSQTKEDSLPSVDLNIEINNLQQFVSSELVAASDIPNIEGVLEAATGKPIADQTNVVIPLKRDKGSTFFIGKTTFEALIAKSLSGSIFNEMPSMENTEENPVSIEDGLSLPHSKVPAEVNPHGAAPVTIEPPALPNE